MRRDERPRSSLQVAAFYTSMTGLATRTNSHSGCLPPPEASPMMSGDGGAVFVVRPGPATVRGLSRAGGEMHPSRRRYLRAGFWAWTLIASVGATVGAVIGCVEIHRDGWPR